MVQSAALTTRNFSPATARAPMQASSHLLWRVAAVEGRLVGAGAGGLLLVMICGIPLLPEQKRRRGFKTEVAVCSER